VRFGYAGLTPDDEMLAVVEDEIIGTLAQAVFRASQCFSRGVEFVVEFFEKLKNIDEQSQGIARFGKRPASAESRGQRA